MKSICLLLLLLPLYVNAQKFEIVCVKTGEKLNYSQIEFYKNDTVVKTLTRENDTIPEGIYKLRVKIPALNYIDFYAATKQVRNLAKIYLAAHNVDTTWTYISEELITDEIYYPMFDYIAQQLDGKFTHHEVRYMANTRQSHSRKYLDINIDSVHISNKQVLKLHALYYTEKHEYHGTRVKVTPRVVQNRKILGIFNRRTVISEGGSTHTICYWTAFEGENSINEFIKSSRTKERAAQGGEIRIYELEIPTDDIGIVKYELNGTDLKWLNYNNIDLKESI